MGAVAAGVSAGLLLSRIVGGLFTDWWGWRGAFQALAGLALIGAVGIAWRLPAARNDTRPEARGRTQSIVACWREFGALRRHTCAGMLWFFAFNLVWVALAIRLAAPPYQLSPAAIGLYSMAGVVGLLVTRVAGRLTDRFGSRPTLMVAMGIASASSVALTVSLDHVVMTCVALALFDAGCFAAQVANQAQIIAIAPERAGALSATYLTLYYVAGAVGAALAGATVDHLGWMAITAIAAIATAAAAAASSSSQPARHVRLT